MPTFLATNSTGPAGVVQTFPVADTGRYFVRAYGARGGGGNGGRGALVQGLFDLTAGDNVLVLVGQRPQGDAGGGGASVVALEDPMNPGIGDATPLLIAAGGGGSAGMGDAFFLHGRAPGPLDTEVDGWPGEGAAGGPGGTGGTGGGGGGTDFSGAGGGGWLTDGGDGTNAGAPYADTGGTALSAGGEGGDAVSGATFSIGGFGGGGGGVDQTVGGGGGGYNGGGGGAQSAGPVRGGGGGSYNGGMSPTGQTGAWRGPGEVLIELLASPTPPQNVTATVVGTTVEVCWESPGTVGWDDPEEVWAEVQRTDCAGVTERVASIPGGLTGCWVDRFAPWSRMGASCTDPDHICELTYEVRYIGVVTAAVTERTLVPAGLILGWDGLLTDIPSGWSRVTALDGVHVRGASGTGSGATGGSATHTHTTGGHSHTLGSHTHPVGGSTGIGSGTAVTARGVSGQPGAALAGHTHARPSRTGTQAGAVSGAAAPGTSAAPNDPRHLTVVWIESDGSATSIPVGALAFGTELIQEFEAGPSGVLLKGAAPGGEGGVLGGSDTHTHTVDAHTHTGGSHTHPIANTGIPNTFVSGAVSGGSTPRFVRSHTHPITVGAVSGGVLAASTPEVTAPGNNVPPYRSLRLLRNMLGGIPPRIIGLFMGDASAITTGLTWCNGSSGTPDMRDLFARSDTVHIGSTGELGGHDHTTGLHRHTAASHTHTISIGDTGATTYLRDPGGNPGNMASAGHDHTSGGPTGAATPSVGAASSGPTDTVIPLPPYVTAHFARLEGAGTTSLDEMVVNATFPSGATANVPTPAPGMGVVKHPTQDVELLICPTVAWTRSRPSGSTQPIEGGAAQVTTAAPGGRDYGLRIPVTTEADLDALETVLGAALFWYQPADGPAGWFTAQPWTVAPTDVRRIRVVNVQVTQVDPYPVPEAAL